MDILICSIISLIATLIGLYLLGEKKSSGFIIFSISLIFQLYIFYNQNNYFLIFQMLVLIIFNVVNYKKWRKN